MSEKEKESVQELGQIDLVEIIVDYMRIFRRMWAWLLILALVFAGVFYLKGRLRYQPMYTASATYTINIQEDQGLGSTVTTAYFNNEAAEQMATTFPHILTSGVLRRRVAQDMGVAAVTSSITASVAENTNFLTISVTDSDAGTAYAVLQSVVKNYPAFSEVIVGKVYMELLDETGIPPYPDNPRSYKKEAVKGALVGVAIVLLWCGLLVITRKTVRKESDIHKYMHTHCLGVVPEIKRKRRSKKSAESQEEQMLIYNPKVEEKLQEPFRMLRNKVEYMAKEYSHKSIVITSALAGEGKSTVAVNLALSLMQDGKKVALIDCDLRHPSDRKILGVEDGPGLGEILQGKAKMNDCVLRGKDLNFTSDMKFIFLPGGATLEDGSELLGSRRMESVIRKMEEWADYVILDSAPAGLLTDAVVLAKYADAAIFVARKDFARVDFIMDGMEHLAESKVQIIGGVLNGA